MVAAPAEEEAESLRTCATGERERKPLFVVGGGMAKVLLGTGTDVVFGRVDMACFYVMLECEIEERLEVK